MATGTSSRTEDRYHDLFSFEFLGQKYALSTRGKPNWNVPVVLRCVDDPDFPAQETTIPSPYENDNVGDQIVCESWDSVNLEFIVGHQGENFINVGVNITERSGSTYLGQFDDSVPPYTDRKENIFLKREGEELFLSYPGVKDERRLPEEPTAGRRVKKSFKNSV